MIYEYQILVFISQLSDQAQKLGIFRCRRDIPSVVPSSPSVSAGRSAGR